MVVRISRDFGVDVLPFSGHYLDTTEFPTKGPNWWSVILRSWNLDLINNCVGEKGQPGWVLSHWNIETLLVLPSTSEMARKWGRSSLGLGGLNLTGIGSVETS